MKQLIEEFKDLIGPVLKAWKNESQLVRPFDRLGRSGGLVLLKSQCMTFIVPDLHGRKEYLPSLLEFEYKGKTVSQWLDVGRAQIVAVGDAMHGEARASERWRRALLEYRQGFVNCPQMDQEMEENLRTVLMIWRLKLLYPEQFHFLKGNHENILDENGEGNRPFAKFAMEGIMTKAYMDQYFGASFVGDYSKWEKSLPLIAKGDTFVISHARPRNQYQLDEIINYKDHPDLIFGLTWTRDQHATFGAVPKMLDMLLGSSTQNRFWFNGHSPVKNLFKFDANEKLVQIHNPDLPVLAVIDPDMDFDPATHVIKMPIIDAE